MTWAKPEQGQNASYIRLEDGSNRVRIVSAPVESHEHFVKDEIKTRVERCGGQGCQQCQSGNEPKKRYHFAAISRNEQMRAPGMVATVKLLTVGQSVYGQLYDLMTSEDWKFDEVPGFDVTIIRKGEGLNTEYSVQPIPAKPLSAADQAVVTGAKTATDLVKERYAQAAEPTRPAGEAAPF